MLSNCSDRISCCVTNDKRLYANSIFANERNVGKKQSGRPKAALLFWFFGDFRCGALLFMVTLVIYKYKNR